LLLFHYLDPPYDSVFFLTGRAGAFSHHPLSVGTFSAGLSAMYIAVAHGLGGLIFSARTLNIAWIKVLAGVLAFILGSSFATGRFSSLAGFISGGH
jgi:hypothetical protein